MEASEIRYKACADGNGHLDYRMGEHRDRWADWAPTRVLLGLIIATLGQGLMNG